MSAKDRLCSSAKDTFSIIIALTRFLFYFFIFVIIAATYTDMHRLLKNILLLSWIMRYELVTKRVTLFQYN